MSQRHLLGLDIERAAKRWRYCRGQNAPTPMMAAKSRELRAMLDEYIALLGAEEPGR